MPTCAYVLVTCPCQTCPVSLLWVLRSADTGNEQLGLTDVTQMICNAAWRCNKSPSFGRRPASGKKWGAHVERQGDFCGEKGRQRLYKQDGAHEPECKHIRQTTVYKKRHSRSESLFHSLTRCWTSCAGDSTTKAACAGDFTTKLCLHHEGSLFCIQIKHWRKGSGRSTARKKQWHCPKISKIST